MSVEENKAIIERFMAEVWNNNKIEELDEFLAPDYYDYSYEPRNREGLASTLALMRDAFPDHQSLIEVIVGEGDNVAICLTLRATQTGPFRGLPPSGKRIEVGGYRFFKLADGKIVSHRALLDLPALLRQIGA